MFNSNNDTKTNIINLTPHNVVVKGEGWEVIFPSKGIARCSQSTKTIGKIGGVPITENVFGEVEGLPEEKEGVKYIVSGLIASALKGKRKDLLVPSEQIRDSEGRIIGCKSLGVIL